MKIMTEIELKPFQVPNFARAKQQTEEDAPGFSVSDISQDALDGLALQWISDLYKKAGKQSPFPREFPKDGSC